MLCWIYAYGMRMLRKNPGFTCVVVLTLPLDRASTSIFSMVMSLLRLLPAPLPNNWRFWRSKKKGPPIGPSVLSYRAARQSRLNGAVYA